MDILPIRHHSPAGASRVRSVIGERRPRVVLVEGPSDATPLISLLLDEATEPPVAIYAYRPGGDGRAAFFPFCDYSPEYVALREGARVGARLAFCDLPAAAFLRHEPGQQEPGQQGVGSQEPDGQAPDPKPEDPAALEGTTPDEPGGYGRYATALAEAAGFASFEELWEAAFEQQISGASDDAYVAAMRTFGGQARALAGGPGPLDEARERHMAACLQAAVREHPGPHDVLLVCGAAHAEAVAAHLADPSLSDLSAPPEPLELVLTPYSFPRLGEQSGYGAGNRAPWFYQQVWEAGGDYEAATRRALVAVARSLREVGQAASVAEVIEAFNLAVVLAGMREKLAPGSDEVREAAIACFGRGEPTAVASGLRQVLVGDRVGRVTHLVGRTPLQAQFYATAEALGFRITDAPREVLLHMTVPREADGSIFLHRLAVARVPFGAELASGLGGSARAPSADPLARIARARERWQVQWTPATDARLVEQSAWGTTLAEVAGRLLRQRLDGATRVDEGTAVLLEMALCDLEPDLGVALQRCEALAADSASFPPLARAAYHLDGLLGYGAARRLPTADLRSLAVRLFDRAALQLPAAAICGDEDMRDVDVALKSLSELVRRESGIVADAELFWRSVVSVAEMPASHPALRGLALVLLDLAGRLGEGELTARISYWLSLAAAPADNANLIAGLFSLQRGVLLRNRALIGSITSVLVDLDLDQLTPLLPVLRRSLGRLSRAERSYLADTLAAVLGAEGRRARWALAASDVDSALLRELDGGVAEVLVRWKERYGID